jgi:mRNA interferase RelE/StbE
MSCRIVLKPLAIKELNDLPKSETNRIMLKIEGLQDNLAGDVTKLSAFTPEYRLRVGNYRVLFEIEGKKVVIYRVLHRKGAYR